MRKGKFSHYGILPNEQMYCAVAAGGITNGRAKHRFILPVHATDAHVEAIVKVDATCAAYEAAKRQRRPSNEVAVLHQAWHDAITARDAL